VIRHEGAQVKIEVTPVLRGCVFTPVVRAVAARVEVEFGFAEMRGVSFEDLYAGKIVAALDRQHPRDLFDVREFLAREGFGGGTARGICGVSDESSPADGGGAGADEAADWAGV